MVESADQVDRPRAGGGRRMFAADAQVGADLARVDWSATALGPPEAWPQSLQTALDILLSSRFSMWMAWGPELTFFCNAAYQRDTLGRKYPWALGRPASEVWAEIWDDIGPRIDSVLATGTATWDEALLLFLERSGYQEESYHTFSYSPLRDDAGRAVGMLCVVSEETERVIGRRRMVTLRDLGSAPSASHTDAEAMSFAARQLERNRQDLPFTAIYLFDESGAAIRAGSTGMPTGHPAMPDVLPAGARRQVWPVERLAAGSSVVVELADAGGAPLPRGAWPDPPTQALAVPLRQQGGRPYGFLVAGLNRYRALDAGYRGFVELVAAHLAAGIAGARSYQAAQRRAEELAELDRAKTVFFSNISHELRTPLTLITGPVQELLSRTDGLDDRARADLELISRSGQRLGKLVNTLLDFSRIEAGRMQARYVPVDLATVTADLAGVFRSAVQRAGLAFTVDCRPLDEPVYLDQRMWEKIIFNLLSNAVKFTFTGSIRVAVRRAGGHAAVTVADTGVGVPAVEMPRLFERFHRVESARARTIEGSGIGLALCKELVELHGGSIDATSAEGEGTTFTIRLPFGHRHLPADAVGDAAGAAAASATGESFLQETLGWLPAVGPPDGPTGVPAADVGPAIAAGLAAPSAPGSGTAVTVLVADDNPDMRGYLTRVLTAAGYRVVGVGDGRQALDAARADPPDLLISDVMMPGMDGLTLVSTLRKDPRTAAVPVVLLSARAGEEASVEGLQAGADDYLVKPFGAAELLARARTSVELTRLRGHHARWRTALVDAMQEGFFVCDEQGAVIEINKAFADILGYGPEGLPYPTMHPWWPQPQADPDGYRDFVAAFSGLSEPVEGTVTVPVTHRDGHRMFVTASFGQALDPATGHKVTIGTIRDVTADHYTIQREAARAALGGRLAQATGLAEALTGALHELRNVWNADRALAVIFPPGEEPEMLVTDSASSWRQLAKRQRRTLLRLRAQTEFTPVSDGSGVGIALQHPAGPMVVWIDLGQGRPFTGDDGLLLSLLAAQLSQGLARVHQSDQQRETAIALQRAILGPSDMPAGFAVRYEPATPPLEVGGDWYDTITLPDGRIGIVVGDCVGRGLHAAAVMGQLRSACRALLLQDAGPAAVLESLDRFAAGVPGALCTTVFCGVLDPRSGHFVYSNAGHPPAVLAGPDGSARLLEGAHGIPLAVRPGAARPEAAARVPARGTLLLYTDGLVERRGQSLTEGFRRACDAVKAGVNADIDGLAGDLMAALAPPGGYDDDVALLLYRHPQPMDMTFPAAAEHLAPVRHALRDWLARCEVAPDEAQCILVAVGEACANAIEHGYRDDPAGAVRLTAEASADSVRLAVSDSGTWRSPGPPGSADSNRGRGFTLMRGLMQHVSIVHGADGTTVHLHAGIT